MTDFVITTIKWKWPAAVKQKDVYKDDERIKTSTKEEALEAISFFINKATNYSYSNHYTITVFKDGEYYTYDRSNQPCLGGLVKYRDTHGEKFSMNPYFPRDLKLSFPDGEIVYIGMYMQGIKKLMEIPYYDFLFSDESPWISAFNSRDSVVFDDNHFVLTDMDTDPTAFYSLMRLGGLSYGAPNKTIHPKAEILYKKCISGCADPRRLAGQKPIVMPQAYWSAGFGIVRPYNESIFKFKLPCDFENFKEFAHSKCAPADSNKYFVDTMKEQFGANMGVRPSKENYDALIPAWDFFKEEAKKLE